MKNVALVNRLDIGSRINNTKFWYSSRLRKASFYLAKFCVSLRLQRIWRVCLKGAVRVNKWGNGSCINLSKCRVAIGLQRRSRFISTKNTIFCYQLDSLHVLRDELVGIKRAFNVRVLLLMKSSLSRCQDTNVNYQENVPSSSCLMCEGNQICIYNLFIIAVNKAYSPLSAGWRNYHGLRWFDSFGERLLWALHECITQPTHLFLGRSSSFFSICIFWC
jgi:hypothetical protein